MGLNQSKPENPYIRDRIRLCDGLAPLDGSHVAAAGAGRFVFILGHVERDQPDDEEMIAFHLDYIDLMLSTRVRLVIGGFCNFGSLAAFYTLDEHTLVLVDVKKGENTLRQRLIAIDPEKHTAHAFLDRAYHLDPRGGRVSCYLAKSAVSEDRVITTVPADNGCLVTIVYPKNPLDLRTQVDDITDVIGEAAHRLRREANTADYRYGIAYTEGPFFLSPTRIGFFTKRYDMRTRQRRADLDDFFSTDTSRVEHSYVVAYDLEADDISTIRIQPDPATNFPCNLELQPPHESLSASGCGKEVVLLITDRHSAWGWNFTVARLYKTAGKLMRGISHLLGKVAKSFDELHFYIFCISCDVRDVRKVRFGLLDTKKMQWREQPGVADQMDFDVNDRIAVSAFPDGHFLIYDRENNSRSAARLIGNSSQKSKEELRVLLNPRRCFSLKTLAEMEIRKRPNARLAILQIAARIKNGHIYSQSN